MLHLTLFFTRRASLQTWSTNGSLEREIALYLRLKQKNVKISFITHGGRQDLELADKLDGIEILCNRWNLPLPLYEYLLPFLFPLHFFKTDVLKTNQTRGAEIALRAAKIWRKPLIARCGYMWSDLMRSEGRTAEVERAYEIERAVFPAAWRVVVTTSLMREYIINEFNVSRERIRVIPNYVLTDIFSPGEIKSVPNRICFIGRLSEEKNLFSFIEACAGLDVDLHFVGEGHLRVPLQEKARELGVQLTLHGSLPHVQLPAFVRESAIFALVSPHEGHPKSLIEAMSCGAAVIGTDVPGIREIIRHGENGWLCGIEPVQIREAIQILLGDPMLRKRLGENARRAIVRRFSLDRVVEMELSLLNEMNQ